MQKKSGILMQTALIVGQVTTIVKITPKSTLLSLTTLFFHINYVACKMEYIPGVLKNRDFLGFECKTFHVSLLIKCPPLLAMIEANLATPKK